MRGKVRALFKKELQDIFSKRSTNLFIMLLSVIILYSFYSAVDLYSKASLAAVNNPLYATGFEPVPGIFVPTFGGLFIMLSLFAPFIFIQTISSEKKYGTIPLIAQYPVPFYAVYIAKIISSVVFLLVSLLMVLPAIIYWVMMGGHLPISELSLLFIGYTLYGLFVISVSLFSASILEETAQASILALFLITMSWFIDFGKDMNILSFLNPITKWSVTKNLKVFESGICSLGAFLFFVGLALFFLYEGYVFFDFDGRKRKVKMFYGIHGLILLFFLAGNINYNLDLTESHRNSFSPEKTEFLKSLPGFKIKIYLDPADSRARDFENDFLKRLLLVKRDVKIEYASPKELKKEYGFFIYSMNGKSEKTYSNSEEEIFRVLADLSGRNLLEEKEGSFYTGYPLVVKKGWSRGIMIFYLIIVPLTFVFLKMKKRR